MVAKAKAKSKDRKSVKSAAPIKKKRKIIPSTEFSVYAPDAKELLLAGDFNNWQSDSKDFSLRRFKGGNWKKMVKLKPGSYEYQFVVDDHWWTDPAAKIRVPNPYGTENSIKVVK